VCLLAELAVDYGLLSTSQPHGSDARRKGLQSVVPLLDLASALNSSFFEPLHPAPIPQVARPAAPPHHVPVITRFKSLSHGLFVDLSVLRLILQVGTGGPGAGTCGC
jgi:hypothetical protein